MPRIAVMTLALLVGSVNLTSAAALRRQAVDNGNAQAVVTLASNMTSQPNCGTPAAPPCTTPAPPCTAPAPCCATPCCPTPSITILHRRVHHKVCCGCCQPEPIKYVLNVKNPCTGCPVEIPLCIPGCTTGSPTVCCGTGIFGRDVLWYEWCNGYSVKVAFTRCGDVIVTTFGS